MESQLFVFSNNFFSLGLVFAARLKILPVRGQVQIEEHICILNVASPTIQTAPYGIVSSLLACFVYFRNRKY